MPVQGLPKHVRGSPTQKALAWLVCCWSPGRTVLEHSPVTRRQSPRAVSQGCYLPRLLRLQQHFRVVSCQIAHRQSTWLSCFGAWSAPRPLAGLWAQQHRPWEHCRLHCWLWMPSWRLLLPWTAYERQLREPAGCLRQLLPRQALQLVLLRYWVPLTLGSSAGSSSMMLAGSRQRQHLRLAAVFTANAQPLELLDCRNPSIFIDSMAAQILLPLPCY